MKRSDLVEKLYVRTRRKNLLHVFNNSSPRTHIQLNRQIRGYRHGAESLDSAGSGRFSVFGKAPSARGEAK